MEKVEINCAAVLHLVEHFDYSNDGLFSVLGVNFYYMTTDSLSPSDGYSVASYYKSTAINGFDIYMYEKAPNKKRMLFHEIIECIYRDAGFGNQEAHGFALEYEIQNFGAR